ncbi:MAG: helix-turn-helix transcriptional regulator [Rhodospirillales bacterium]|nr:helix-turn-helix transcriptional regulator [Rhodospirillales bacterium]
MEGECSVGELAQFLTLRDSTVSQHLSLLRKDGLVETRREAQTVRYSIKDPAARRILGVLHEIYCADPKQK